MDNSQIEAFMDVIKYGTISAAARSTYTSQSYLSHKIKLLEEELGVSLLSRGKGTRSVELTAYGNEFLRLAQQYQSTWNDMLSVREYKGRTNLSIGGVDSVNSFTFEQLYNRHLQIHEDICLSVHTYHSRDLYRRVEAKQIDLAYVYNVINHTDIILTPLYSEPMFLVCRSDSPYHNRMSPADLPANQEIYMRINSEFEIWHDRFWPSRQYLIRITSSSLLSYLLSDPRRWAIANISIINQLKKLENLKVYTLNVEPPVITCYQIEHKYPRPSRINAMDIFKKEVLEYLSSQNYIKRID